MGVVKGGSPAFRDDRSLHSKAVRELASVVKCDGLEDPPEQAGAKSPLDGVQLPDDGGCAPVTNRPDDLKPLASFL